MYKYLLYNDIYLCKSIPFYLSNYTLLYYIHHHTYPILLLYLHEYILNIMGSSLYYPRIINTRINPRYSYCTHLKIIQIFIM